VIYVIAPSIWGLIDLPLRADFLPTHPSDYFAIDLPNVPVSRAAVGVAEEKIIEVRGNI
jgi:hypothetical protein